MEGLDLHLLEEGFLELTMVEYLSLVQDMDRAQVAFHRLVVALAQMVELDLHLLVDAGLDMGREEVVLAHQLMTFHPFPNHHCLEH